MKLNQYIDHTILKADATKEQVEQLIAEAKEHEFASVCLNPFWVRLAHEQLKDSPVEVCTVIGFPLGATTTASKAFEARDAVANGADEVDMVINIGALKSKEYGIVKDDIAEVVKASAPAIVKVIIETALLTEEEKVKACELAVEAGAHFVKTSTGFSTKGATVEDVRLMRATVGPNIGVKAAGGIHTYEDAVALIEAGANRLGASASLTLIASEK